MSNGGPHDHPGEYLTMRVPADAVAINALVEAQELIGFKLVTYNESFITFYHEDEH